MPEISLITTLYNEEANVAQLIHAVDQALQERLDYELILVDDGSTDRTLERSRKAAHARCRILELSKNYGQSTAIAAGIDAAQGRYIATLDGDLQNDPQDIPAMLDTLIAGEWDLVAGIRQKRQDGFLLRKLPSRLANVFIRWLTRVGITDHGCTLKVFRAPVAKGIRLYGELHRFIPELAFLNGARITQMPVRHHARRFGTSKYGLSRTFRVLADLVLIVFFQRYLLKPMHLFGATGIVAFLIGVLINLYLLGLKIIGQDIWGKPLLVLALLLTLGGIQLITIGIIVEIMMRIYYESQDKKTYLIRAVYTADMLEETGPSSDKDVPAAGNVV